MVIIYIHCLFTSAAYCLELPAGQEGPGSANREERTAYQYQVIRVGRFLRPAYAIGNGPGGRTPARAKFPAS